VSQSIRITNPTESKSSLSVDLEEFHPHHGWQRRPLMQLTPGGSFETYVEKMRRRLVVNEE
jgi:hypothetical protein